MLPSSSVMTSNTAVLEANKTFTKKSSWFEADQFSFNPNRFGVFKKVNDPGVGALKALTPYDLENCVVNLYYTHERAFNLVFYACSN